MSRGQAISFQLNTERLWLRKANLTDAEFMLRLLNEPSWRKYIARHDITTIGAAENYLQERIIPVYESGLGFHIIELKLEKIPVGICGLIKRPYLSEVDLGFALLEQYWGTGLAHEASLAMIRYAREHIRLNKLQGITVPHNNTSIKLLKKLNFVFKEEITDEKGEELLLYEKKLSAERNINSLHKN